MICFTVTLFRGGPPARGGALSSGRLCPSDHRSQGRSSTAVRVFKFREDVGIVPRKLTPLTPLNLPPTAAPSANGVPEKLGNKTFAALYSLFADSVTRRSQFRTESVRSDGPRTGECHLPVETLEGDGLCPFQGLCEVAELHSSSGSPKTS
jgi:hypothetical protein